MTCNTYFSCDDYTLVLLNSLDQFAKIFDSFFYFKAMKRSRLAGINNVPQPGRRSLVKLHYPRLFPVIYPFKPNWPQACGSGSINMEHGIPHGPGPSTRSPPDPECTPI